ncbi:MAG TPA: MG2 domain-containing protein, partial [Herpetosiphonaceae bacterium]
PLSADQAAALLARLKPLEDQAGDRQPFALRDDSLPPPQAGADLRLEPLFPPAAAPDEPSAAPSGPLAVLRRAPEGAVDLAAQLSVTFSQPMVAVGSHDQAAQTIPVLLTPQPPGQWRWVGAQTLLFEADGHLPMATDYEAVVPAGTLSATGQPLAEEVRWRFSTPPPRLISSYPTSGPQRRDQPIFLGFDQLIDAEAVAGGLELRADGRRAPVRLASAAEIAADPQLQALADRHQRGRWLAVAPAAPLPADAEISMIVPAGTPSAEGPRVTAEAQSFGFRTFGPLTVTGQRCGWGDDCQPWQPWTIELSNPLDEAAFRPEQVRIEPAIEQVTMSAAGTQITIHGANRGRTRYEVTLAADLADVFGQTLGAPETLVFEVGPAPSALLAPGGNRIILDPAGPRSFSIYSVNHERLTARLFAVGPEHWDALNSEDPPGELKATIKLEPAARPDELIESKIDLAPALEDGFGQVLLVVEPAEQPPERWRRQRVTAWLQSTKLGLATFAERGAATIWASSLADGTPAEGVAVSLASAEPAALTGADGLARLGAQPGYNDLVIARRGRDVALLPVNAWSLQHQAFPDQRWFVFDDRTMYRPGEEVRVKGWRRRVDPGKGGDVSLDRASLPARLLGRDTLPWRLVDSRGNEVASGQIKLGELGGFDLAIQLPPTMNLGAATLFFGPANQPDHSHNFEVQEFRRPEFEVTASASPGPHFADQPASATVTAAYYAGGGLPGAETTWQISLSQGWFAPPGWSDWTFGVRRPWWDWSGGGDEPSGSASLAGRTDGAGSHTARIELAGRSTQPLSVSAEATVMDVNRQAWTAASALLFHPAACYAGLRVRRAFVQAGQPLPIELIVADLDGRPLADHPLTLQIVRVVSDWANGRWTREEELVSEETIRSGAAPLERVFTAERGGSYLARATVSDETGRRQQSQLSLWVAGRELGQQRLDGDRVLLIADRETYQPGETAEILIQAPWLPAEGTLTVSRSGLLEARRFRMDEPTFTARVPIGEEHLPNLHVRVDLIGAAPRNDA